MSVSLKILRKQAERERFERLAVDDSRTAIAKSAAGELAANATEALKMAFQKQGSGAKVAVLRYGGHVLPVVDDEAKELGRL